MAVTVRWARPMAIVGVVLIVLTASALYYYSSWGTMHRFELAAWAGDTGVVVELFDQMLSGDELQHDDHQRIRDEILFPSESGSVPVETYMALFDYILKRTTRDTDFETLDHKARWINGINWYGRPLVCYLYNLPGHGPTIDHIFDRPGHAHRFRDWAAAHRFWELLAGIDADSRNIDPAVLEELATAVEHDVLVPISDLNRTYWFHEYECPTMSSERYSAALRCISGLTARDSLTADSPTMKTLVTRMIWSSHADGTAAPILSLLPEANHHTQRLYLDCAMAYSGGDLGTFHPIHLWLDALRSSEPTERSVAAILIGQALSSRSGPRAMYLIRERIQRTVLRTSTSGRSEADQRQLYALQLVKGRQQEHCIPDLITRNAVKLFPVYDWNHGQITSLNAQMREMAGYLVLDPTGQSPVLVQLENDFKQDPVGTAFDLIFGDRIHSVSQEAARINRSIYSAMYR